MLSRDGSNRKKEEFSHLLLLENGTSIIGSLTVLATMPQ